jgi:hypothetical protein
MDSGTARIAGGEVQGTFSRKGSAPTLRSRSRRHNHPANRKTESVLAPETPLPPTGPTFARLPCPNFPRPSSSCPVDSIPPPSWPAPQRDGYAPYTLAFRYGQRHAIELDCAEDVARTHGRHRAPHRHHRPGRLRGQLPDRARRGPQGPRRRCRSARASPVHLRAGPQHRLPLVRPGLGRGPGGAKPSTSGSTRWTTRAIPTAAPSSSPPSSAPRAWPRAWAPRARPLSIVAPLQNLSKGGHHRAGTVAGRRLRPHPFLLRSPSRRRAVPGVRLLPPASGGFPRRRACPTPACCASASRIPGA